VLATVSPTPRCARRWVRPSLPDLLVPADILEYRNVDALQGRLRELESQLEALHESNRAASASTCPSSRAADEGSGTLPGTVLKNAVGCYPSGSSKDKTTPAPVDRTSRVACSRKIDGHAASTLTNEGLEANDVAPQTTVARDVRHHELDQVETALPGMSINTTPYSRGPYASRAAAVSEDEPLPTAEVVQDSAETPATDGMVDYMPDGSNFQCEGGSSIRSSPALDFAVQLQAKSRKSCTTLCGWNSPGFQTKSSSGSSRHGVSTWRVPGPEVMSVQHHPRRNSHRHPQDEHLHALKLYFSGISQRVTGQRMIATGLLDHYFVAVHPIWPFLIEERTRDEFERVFAPNRVTGPAQMAKFNLIFALGCLLSGENLRVADTKAMGEQFYFRALGFIIAHAFCASNVDMVQALLLLAQYQQGTLRSGECWLTVGQATGIALALGFHKDSPSSGMVSRIDIELQNKLWWGCFCFDR
jgi:hypothetical protein